MALGSTHKHGAVVRGDVSLEGSLVRILLVNHKLPGLTLARSRLEDEVARLLPHSLLQARDQLRDLSLVAHARSEGGVEDPAAVSLVLGGSGSMAERAEVFSDAAQHGHRAWDASRTVV